MSTRPRARALVAALTAFGGLALGVACDGDAPPQPPPTTGARNPAALVEGEPYRPRIDPADFVAVIDNPYLPLRPGARMLYEGVSDGERETVEVFVTDRTKEVMGVTTTVVRDRVFVDGELVEETFDWYAQDRQGNVWYFGEDSAEYEGGVLVSTKGSWEAGMDGAQPGIVMLADPREGDEYRQEYYPGEAEDAARVLGVDESAAVPYGSFDGVLLTEDWTPLEPDVAEYKFYAPGVGVVEERLVRGGEGVLRLVEVRTG